jgi:putative Holliday junction resolvase
MTARCTRFANQLRGRFGLDVEYAEERLSSVEAAERLRAAGTARHNARQHLDAIAAQLILQGHFDGFAEQGIDHLSPRPEHPDDREDDTRH